MVSMMASMRDCVSGGKEDDVVSDASLLGVDVNVRTEESALDEELVKRVHWFVGARRVRPRCWYGGGGEGDRDRVGCV